MFSFFQKSHRVGKEPCVSFLPQIVLVPELSDSGSLSIQPTVLETVLEPLATLDFTDFQISECLKHGVNYKALKISPDLRLGFDDEIKSLNAHIDEMNDQLFNLPKSV